MCGSCFQKEYSSFPSYWIFDEFDLRLTQKLQAAEGLRYAEQIQIDRFHSVSAYKCGACGTTWQLSEPDNAWRGFFLTEPHARAYLKNIGHNDRARSFGCLAIAVILLALASIWLFSS